MVKKNNTTAPATTTSFVTPASVVAAPAVVAPVVVTTKSNSKKKSTSTTTTPAPAIPTQVVAPVITTPAVASVTPVAGEAPVTTAPVTSTNAVVRRQVNKESFFEDIKSLVAKINEEIEKRTPSTSTAAPTEATTEATAATATTGAATAATAASNSKKPKRKKENLVPVKFLRTINKRLATIQADAAKLWKLNKKKVGRENANSGLKVPVKISPALEKFLKDAGKDEEGNAYAVDTSKPIARIDITNKIHSYVKQHKLRKGELLTTEQIATMRAESNDEKYRPRDLRIIIPDAKLAALLGAEAVAMKDKLTYFKLPKILKSHVTTIVVNKE